MSDARHDEGPASGRRRARGRRVAGLVAAALVVAATAAPAAAGTAPAVAAEPTAAPNGAVSPAPTSAPAVAAQAAPGDEPGPYDPGFDDEPLRTNPISPALDDVPASSAELDRVAGALRAAEGRHADAIAHRDDLRRQIVELGEQRAAAVEALAQRQTEERQRGEERVAAVAAHEQRKAELAEAEGRLSVAQDQLRDLMVAAYVSTASSTTDALMVLSSRGDLDAAFLRLGYSDTSSSGRVADVEQRVRERDEAIEARDAAARAQEAAEQAERDAVAARQAAEELIVDIDDETARTQDEEADAVAAVSAREADVYLAAAEIAPARLRAPITAPGLDFPVVALDAFVKAAASAPCHVEWWVLAGISKIEGGHGTYGGAHLGARGYPSREIIGPQLNGAGAFAEIRDTDGGLWDHDTAFDRAVGPMQFIPSTWKAWGRDGDGDGIANPHTFYDATTGAAAYLCYGRSDLSDEGQLRSAYFSYNHSDAYVAKVLAAARGYQAAITLPPHVPELPATG